MYIITQVTQTNCSHIVLYHLHIPRLKCMLYWILTLPMLQLPNKLFFIFPIKEGPSWSWLNLQLPLKLVSITTKVVSSNPVHDEVYTMQHYVIEFVSDLRQVGRWFSPSTPVSSTNKTDRHDITEILLKVALNTTSPQNPPIKDVKVDVRFIMSRVSNMLLTFWINVFLYIECLLNCIDRTQWLFYLAYQFPSKPVKVQNVETLLITQ